MQLDLKNYQQDFGSELICPHCENHRLHHTCVEVFERGEDAETGTHVVVSADKVVHDANMKDNPSARRHGLLIRLGCENCGKESVLTIAHHKGGTLLDIE